MDFTIKIYEKLINTLIAQGFSFLTFEEFISNPRNKSIILRHDVDALPMNSLNFARTLSRLQIKGTFYFRIVPKSFNETIIKLIYSLGHEIGYHYEDIASTAHHLKGIGAEEIIVKTAIVRFSENLEKIRRICPVKTICMHGSPLSRWDSRLLWKYFDYRKFGISGEPYLDLNFDEILYLTDTGRRWDGDSVNIRDKKSDFKTLKEISFSSNELIFNDQSAKFRFHSTHDIINAAEGGMLPGKLMFTFHPQRWSDKIAPWAKELIWQNVKNTGKFLLINLR